MTDRTQSQEDSTLAQSQVRAAANQSLARDVNERIDQLRTPSTFVQFVCECALEDCDEVLALTQQEYEALRAHANRFVVAPGHVVAQVEVVMGEHRAFRNGDDDRSGCDGREAPRSAPPAITPAGCDGTPGPKPNLKPRCDASDPSWTSARRPDNGPRLPRIRPGVSTVH
jgi:hypothetical protein